MGTEAYGVWLLIQSTVGYYGLIDMGLRAGLTQSIARKIAKGDVSTVVRQIESSILVLSLLGFLLFLLSFPVGFLLPSVVQIDAPMESSILLLLVLQALVVGIRLPMSAFEAVLVGHQRYDISNAIGCISTVANGIATWLILNSGGGLVGISLAMLVVATVGAFFRFIAAGSLLPKLRRIRPRFNRAEFSELVSASFWNTVIRLGAHDYRHV